VKNIFILFLFLASNTANAQTNLYTIKGKVVESSSNLYIDYATVVVNDLNTGQMLAGSTTENGGKFEVAVATKNVSIEVSFIGFSNLVMSEIIFDGNTADLGTLKLGEDSQTLDEVVVTAEKSSTEFKLDKRVFNVGTDLSTTGAGALELLNNVPSVNVSIEGDVTLRGAGGVQILINGKPSVLADDAGSALGSITADMIDRVEVITNPSAKYEAEGTAGIINIVLKKEEKRGLNGSLTLNTGTPHNHSVGLSLNRRTEKFNLFTQLGIGYRELPSDNVNINRNLANNTELTSFGEAFRNETFYNVILGSDYYINPLNVITLSGSFAYEVEDQPSQTSFTFANQDVVELTWLRTEDTEATNPKLQYELQYAKEFKDNKEHKLLFSAIGRFFGKDQSSLFKNEFAKGIPNQTDQITETEFKEGKYTFNLDYTKPFNENWTLETGAQYLLNKVSNDFAVSNEENGEFIIDENLTNVFEYNQNVLGVYTTGAYEGKAWGLKLGLRVENTDLSTLLVNTKETNNQNFTNLFPSAHTSYKLTDGISFQAGYSRRIYRPRLWDLNPFFNNATGIEGNFKYSPIKKITFNGDLNYNVFKRDGEFNDQVFDFSADQWSAKLTTKYKVSRSLDVEITGRHQSREQTVQGTRAANTFADFGLRYKIMKGRGVFNLSVRDIFASRIRQTTVDQPDFYVYNWSQRGRFITAGFSYGFGKGEAMTYSGGRRR